MQNRQPGRPSRFFGVLAALLLSIFATANPYIAEAAIFGVPNGAVDPNGWLLLDGTSSSNNDGDTVHEMTFKIEVTGTTLDVQVFDAGSSGARDLTRGSGDTSTTYTLRNPAGGILANVAVTTDSATTQNALARLTATGFQAIGSSAPFSGLQPGLYELRVAMGNNTRVNGFGLNIPNYQVYTSTDVPTGAEDGQLIGGTLNSDSAPLANVTQPMIMYPYVDRGCDLTTTNYDMDWPVGAGAGSTGALISRLGTSTALTMSGGTVPVDNNVNVVPLATQAQDYGIWRLNNDLGTQQNLVDWRIADYTGLTVVGANLPHEPDAPFRIYLPADGSLPGTPVAPLEPRLEQSLTPLGGANPPAAGMTSYYAVNVALTNPTASAITSVTLTANVPGGQVVYESSNPPLITAGAQVTGGGSVTSEPADGGSGDVVATWASVASGATVSLSYFLAVTPSGAGAVNVTPTPASGNATRVTYTPAFSSVTYPGTESMGPLCQLAIQASTAVPNAVSLASLEAQRHAGGVHLDWATDAEWANLGFNVYRAEGPAGAYEQLNRDLILGHGTSSLRARYLFIDATARPDRAYAYLLEDVERTGVRTLHGPAHVAAGAIAPGTPDLSVYDHVSTNGGTLGRTALLALGSGGLSPNGNGGPGATAPVSQSPPGAAGGGYPLPAPAAESPSSLVRILREDADGMTLELSSRHAVLSGVVLDGIAYTDVSVPGFSQLAEPGKPALPVIGVPIKIPDVADVSVTVEREQWKPAGIAALPAPAPEWSLDAGGELQASYQADPGTYEAAGVFPDAPLQAAGSVRQGDDRIFVLAFKPVKWDPGTGALLQARKLRVRLAFAGRGSSAAMADPDARRENQFWLAAQGAIKIAVSETGLQRVSGEALIAAGLPAVTDPRRLALYTGGAEVALRVAGEADGVLDPGDNFYFYGEALESAQAQARTYWLVAGNLTGLRMEAIDAAPRGAPFGETTTPAVARLEKNLVYVPFVLNGETSNFVGDFIFQNPRDQFLTLSGVTGGPADLRVRIQGATSDASVNPDHHVRISVNGVDLGDAHWDGFGAFDGSFPVPPGALVDGSNQIRFTPVADTGAAFDFDYIDWLALTHTRSLADAGAALALEAGAPGDRTVSGLAGGTPAILDVSDPRAPRWLTGATFDSATGSVAFHAEGGRRHLVAAPDGVKLPKALWRDVPSRLNESPGLDWLAITHGSLVEDTLPLSALRAGEGLRVAVADVQDVYDEFNNGDPDPQAIKDYLAWQYARGGAPRLRYVLLVGDASYDPRNYLKGSNPNLVPTKLLDGTFVEHASDNWFAAFLGDDALPDVAIGRLPVKDAAQLQTVVSKLSGYAALPLGSDWQRRALLVADDGFRAFHAGEAAIFEGATGAMAGALPPGFDALSIQMSQIPEADQATVTRQGILDALNAGVLLAAYAGHGGITLWADEVVFRSSDLAQVSNLDRLPFVVVLNCLNGFFHGPTGDALGESLLLKPDGGAVAAFTPTSVSPIGGQSLMGEAISRAIFREGELRIGDALVRARAAMLGLEFFDDFSNSWVLLGDPATRLAFEPEPIADAGEDQTLMGKGRARLDGRGSGGVPGALSYDWRIVSQPAGSSPKFKHAASATPEIQMDTAGEYRVELVVSQEGRTSLPDSVKVLILPKPNGKPAPIDPENPT
ncbi:MAG: C25 family cysteine peptidase [Deltaproteobacteria bacterium]|nr:C25 family cysteine peptidase [Deltaproteobacteria bacterium]